MQNDAAGANNNEGIPSPIRLVGGVNFTTWSDLKWARANAHFGALQAGFLQWQASAPVSIDAVLHEDRQGLDMVARIPQGIPKHDWALALGDTVHNLRSALDAVAWGMAHFNDAKPSQPKAVAFPICTKPKQWADVVENWVGAIHPEFQERLWMLQPFTHAEGQMTVLSVLHALDIQDKHRDTLVVTPDVHTLELGLSFEYEGTNVMATPRLDMKDVKFEDGVTIGTMHAGAPIRVLSHALRPSMRMHFTYDEVAQDVMQTLQLFVAETRRYLDILLFGPPPESDGSGWSPMDVGPPPA